MTEHDDDLRAAFDALRAHDATAAPPFERSIASARSALRERRIARRKIIALGAAVAIAAAVLLAVLRPRPGVPELDFASAEPLRFLSRPPSASVIGTEPLAIAEESF
jgi:hypothetical protein